MRKLATAALALFMTGAGMNGALATTDNGPFEVTATGVGPTGYLKVVIEAFHNIYRDVYPGTTATFVPGTQFGGMVQAAAGQMDVVVGVTPVETAYALEGRPPFKAALEGQLYQLASILETTRHYFIADRQWAEANGISTVADIAEAKPRIRLALGSQATPYINDTAEAVFKEYGFSTADIESWGGTVHYYPSGRGIDDLKDGKVDMQIISTLHPDSRLIDLNRSRPVVWLPVGAEVLEKIAPQFEMDVVTLPATTYDFMEEDQPTLQAFASMLVGKHVPEDAAYKMARALGENIDRVRGIHPSLSNFGPETMVRKSAGVEYHPGALRYYREKGWVD